jgi:peptide/nickel transport system substrate-binding protein
MIAVLAVLAAACTGGGSKPAPATSATLPPAGGTLRVGVLIDGGVGRCDLTFCGGEANDPQINGIDGPTYELLRCCLLRSLLSYNGQSTSGGGTLLRPDVAASLPEVSPDGLTWTFHLRKGLHYAPPLESTEITAGDFIRSVERLMGPPPADLPPEYGAQLDIYLAGFLSLTSIIAGGDAYANGTADHVSGLEAPDAHTFVLHLTAPDGSLGYLFSLPDTAPIPPNPYDPAAPFGVAEGHGRYYTRHLVASGPYMLDGAPDLDFSRPPDQQVPASGDTPNGMLLVRNPSWDPKTDTLRKAYVDRIELVPVSNEDEGTRLVRSGALDLVLNQDPSPEELQATSAGPHTATFSTTSDEIQYLALNLAIPPLDDVHVRRAINYAIARGSLLPSFAQAGKAAVATTHIGLDSEENNLLLNFDPFHVSTGDPQEAKAEMSRSKYDADHDGRCDTKACSELQLMVPKIDDGRDEAARAIAAQLHAIGLRVEVVVQDPETYGSAYRDPRAHAPMRIDGWLKDLVSGATYFPFLFGSPAVGVNHGYGEGLLGASPAQLRRWGYLVTSVPNVDDRIIACLPLTFNAQLRCWADLDQYLMNETVPWVPLVGFTTGRVVSDRLTRFSFDQAWGFPFPALDQIAVRPGSSPSPMPEPSNGVPAIPPGRYQVTITKQDILRFDPHTDSDGIRENTGTTIITLRPDGWFESWQRADHALYHPLNVGRYTGSGDTVTFETVAFVGNAITTPPMRWTFDGKALRLQFLGCSDLNRLDPGAPHLCDDLRVFYEAHPWTKVG